MIGDAAGMIAPLCGNGMSMALHASKVAAKQIQRFLSGTISRQEMEQSYSANWNELFGNRLQMGRRLQKLFDNQRLTSFMIGLGRHFPFVIRALIKRTHGKSF